MNNMYTQYNNYFILFNLFINQHFDAFLAFNEIKRHNSKL